MHCQRCGSHKSRARANEEGAAGSDGHQFDDILSTVVNTHRSANGSRIRRNGQLNTLICLETIDAACGN